MHACSTRKQTCQWWCHGRPADERRLLPINHFLSSRYVHTVSQWPMHVFKAQNDSSVHVRFVAWTDELNKGQRDVRIFVVWLSKDDSSYWETTIYKLKSIAKWPINKPSRIYNKIVKMMISCWSKDLACHKVDRYHYIIYHATVSLWYKKVQKVEWNYSNQKNEIQGQTFLCTTMDIHGSIFSANKRKTK